MTLRLVPRQDDPIDQAAYWAAKNAGDAVDEADKAEFAAWLADPDNAEAYARAEEALDIFEGADAFGDDLPDLAALREEAQAFAAPARRRRWRGAAAGLIAASLVVALGFTLVGPGGPANDAPVVAVKDSNGIPVVGTSKPQGAYATAIGEQRVLVLEDGTRVTMNTGTQIAIDYRQDRRIVRLLRGQALFDVAHNPSRPFSVVAADRQVVALGTVFEVRLDRDRLQVTLVRGRVKVTQQGGADSLEPSTPVFLDPGQQFAAALGSARVEAPAVARVDVEKQLLWRQSRVEFDDIPVAQAVAELNRYSLQPIVIADSRAGSMRISGVFRTGDPEAFADLVGAMLPISASENGRGEIELRSAAPAKN